MIFGAKIDANTLAGMQNYPSDPSQITARDCANVALSQMVVNLKDADDNVNSMKQEYGNGITTEVMIYNATGYDMNFVSINNISGGVYGPFPIDPIVANGQWCSFIYVHPAGQAVGTQATATWEANGSNIELLWQTNWSDASGGPDSYSAVLDESLFSCTPSAGTGTTVKVIYLIYNISQD